MKFELCPLAEPGSKHVDDPAGEEPKGQKINIFFAKVIYIIR